MTYQSSSTNGTVFSCTCEIVDATAIGDSSRHVLAVMNPSCPVHLVTMAGPSASSIVVDDEAETIPEVACVRCTRVTPLKSSSWNEHDHRFVGWWCKDCRVGAGFDVRTQMVTMREFLG